MQRRMAAYEPGRPPRRPRRSPFRTARLNTVGWSALLGACLVASGAAWWVVGSLADLGSGWAVVAAAVGATGPLVAVLHADRRRWRTMEVGFGWGASLDEVEVIAGELRAGGVAVTAEPATAPGESASLRYRNVDRARVATVLRQHGVDAPPPP